MATINLATKFLPLVDEKFTAESKKSLLTNNDFNWTGAHSVKVYKVSTSGMNDYDRAAANTENWSRFGPVGGLDAVTEEMVLKKDRSFTFAIDKLDTDETVQQLQAATALERQLREVVIPEVDAYTYSVMAENAGTKVSGGDGAQPATIYASIIEANRVLDEAEVPETGRMLIVTPDCYTSMKLAPDIMMETDIANEMRLKGVIGYIDGAAVIKVPAKRLPEGAIFMLCHPSATVAPSKLEDYRIHSDPPGISGSLVEGRICYDAFVLDNKKMAIYYKSSAVEGETDETA